MQMSAEFEEYLERIAREIREKAMAAGLTEDFAKWYAEEYRKRYAEEYLKGYAEEYRKGYEEGLVLGRNEVKTEIAANLSKEKLLSPEEIERVTGISIEQVSMTSWTPRRGGLGCSALMNQGYGNIVIRTN